MGFYSLAEMLDNGYKTLGEMRINKKKNKVVKPDIMRKNRKSIIVNFKDFCISINRDIDSVQKFLATELSISTSISADGKLVFNKMLYNKNIMGALCRYIETYVMCGCGSKNTNFSKVNKIIYLECSDCKSKKSLNHA